MLALYHDEEHDPGPWMQIPPAHAPSQLSPSLVGANAHHQTSRQVADFCLQKFLNVAIIIIWNNQVCPTFLS